MMPTPTRHLSTRDRARSRMLGDLRTRGIEDQRVLSAMGELPRHHFVDEALAGHAYGESTLPIGDGQTLSQPYTVARMTEVLKLSGDEHVLEIGTGSGYQTAVLALLCRRVYSVERIGSLAATARVRLGQLGLDNVTYRVGDGSIGWPDHRGFDCIIVTAGAPVIAQRLERQLHIGGVMVIPLGDRRNQQMMRVERLADTIWQRDALEACRFVPLVGQGGWEPCA
uniref:Protein-L-isoaspartate O-methyltransferase n=1 Tax=Magnetococcus massalia (strain MO-1) TaxID=451514 RepID=A0A1S7LJM5_MAGMO|nr:Protein-L-isoaspartate O-methyltransferase (Protein-beta-aspartate methyltransferase) (PIMT) (Protein L-isoaspartyl methyltransferase) (L-isoaspartyl protein carboxyl methyltransferase) [Candidatus Magnetococcus massalia]